MHGDENEEQREAPEIVGRYTVVLRGCDTPRLAYGVRGGLIAVVAAPLNIAAEAAGMQAGDEVVSVDDVPLRSGSGGSGSAAAAASQSRLEAAAIKRMQGLRGRRSVRWLLRRPRRATRPVAPPPPPPFSFSSASSFSSSSVEEEGEEEELPEMVEMSAAERRLMGALGNTAG
eukprot:COSAG06_NODE_4502_length_4199_cov_204.819024_5_plen_173_part_00